jgi:hypothetical protein
LPSPVNGNDTAPVVADATDAVRSLVLPDRGVAQGLTEQGVSATTYHDILGQPAETLVGYFTDEPAVVVSDGTPAAAGVINKLQNDGIPTVVVDELLDPERRP